MPTESLDFIDNSNILGEHLGNRNLHLNKHGHLVLGNDFIKCLRSSFWVLDDFLCVRAFQTQSMDVCGINSFTNYVSEKSVRVIRQENSNHIIFVHVNIKSLRNKFDLLANQIIRNVDVLVISETKLDVSFLMSNLKSLVSRPL